LKVLFTLLQEKLVAHLRNRVHSGEFTERSLARATGISQPHIHNVLKGIRTLSPEYADLIVAHFGLTISDLLTYQELGITAPPALGVSLVPRLGGVAGPSHIMGESIEGVYPMPHGFAETLSMPVMLELTHDPNMFPYFQNGDLALVDRCKVSRSALQPLAVYLVQRERGTTLRYLRTGGTRLYLLTPYTLDEPRKWESLSLSGRQLEDVIRGRIAWIGRASRNDSHASVSLTTDSVPPSDSR
jgi:hypothetical protein